MLKHKTPLGVRMRYFQPPSGGCVLKLAFFLVSLDIQSQPPSGGCVLKLKIHLYLLLLTSQPPSGGCVLKPFLMVRLSKIWASRLRAAVC